MQHAIRPFFNTETGTTTIVKDFGEGSAAHTLRTTGWASSSSERFLPSSGIVHDIENQVSLGSVQ